MCAYSCGVRYYRLLSALGAAYAPRVRRESFLGEVAAYWQSALPRRVPLPTCLHGFLAVVIKVGEFRTRVSAVAALKSWLGEGGRRTKGGGGVCGATAITKSLTQGSARGRVRVNCVVLSAFLVAQVNDLNWFAK